MPTKDKKSLIIAIRSRYFRDHQARQTEGLEAEIIMVIMAIAHDRVAAEISKDGALFLRRNNLLADVRPFLAISHKSELRYA